MRDKVGLLAAESGQNLAIGTQEFNEQLALPNLRIHEQIRTGKRQRTCFENARPGGIALFNPHETVRRQRCQADARRTPSFTVPRVDAGVVDVHEIVLDKHRCPWKDAAFVPCPIRACEEWRSFGHAMPGPAVATDNQLRVLVAKGIVAGNMVKVEQP